MNATDTLNEVRCALLATRETLDERHAADLEFRARSRKSRTNHARRLGLDGAEPKSPLGGEQPAGEAPSQAPLRRMPRQPQWPRGPAMEQLKVEVGLLLVDELLKHSAVADVKGMEVAIAIVRASARLKMENPLHQQAAREYGEQFLSELSARHAVKKARGEAGCQPWREEVVRADVKCLAEVQRAGLEALKAARRRSAHRAFWIACDQAHLDVLERLLYSSALSSRAKLLRYAQLIPDEAVAPKSVGDSALYRKAFREAVGEVSSYLLARYQD